MSCAHPKSKEFKKMTAGNPILVVQKLISLISESGADVMSALADREACYGEEKKLFSSLVDLLSYEKITFNGKLNLI